MDSVDRKRLRELAMAATPGPWYDAGCCTVHDANHYEVAHPFDCANVPFIAAANPQTILALLDALYAAEQRATDNARRWQFAREGHYPMLALARRDPDNELCVLFLTGADADAAADAGIALQAQERTP